MRAFVLAALLSLAPASGFALVTAPLAGAASARPGRVVMTACDRAARTASFDGRMDQVDGGARMSMRFLLQVREPAASWHRVRVPGFSSWHTSDPGPSRYVYTKELEGLVGPSAYRVIAHFRWLDADGGVVRRSRATSRACHMPDPRPDLRVWAIAVRPSRTHYAVTVRNAGHSTAGASELSLDLGDGGRLLTAPVDPLAAGESRTVVLAGRACAPGATLTATADATGVVDERREDDDTLAVTCP